MENRFVLDLRRVGLLISGEKKKCFKFLAGGIKESVVRSLWLMRSRKEDPHEADNHTSICVHLQAKCEAVEIDLSNSLLVK